MKRIFTRLCIIAFFYLFFFASLTNFAQATNYYVTTSGNDANQGNFSNPLKTIQRCANLATGGDTCYINSGLYNERVSIPNSGSTGKYINFIGIDPENKPVMRGFDISGKNYIRVINFEITHLNWSTPTHAIYIGGGSRYVEIINNYIHHTGRDDGGQAIRIYPSDHVIIRGNEITRSSCSKGEGFCGCNGYGIGGHPDSHYILAEYNHIHGIGSDFIDMGGSYNIIRNNYLHDLNTSIWSCIPHVDFFQAGSDGMAMNVQHHIYESNFMGDNADFHSHVFQMRSNVPSVSDHDMIIRGNVAYNVGSYVQQAGGIDNVSHYNNAYYDVVNKWPTARGGAIGHNVERTSTGLNPSIGNSIFNNIIQQIYTNHPVGIDGTSAGSGSQVNISNNINYLSLNQSGWTYADPKFTNIQNKDFHLQADSPAIGAGKALTTVTSQSGSGTTFSVNEAKLFTEGFGIAEGDIIKVGGNQPVRIISISESNIIVDRSITWNNGDGIYWRNQDNAPDIGAYEFRESGYAITANLNLENNAILNETLVTITASVNDPNLVRFVEFWIDEVPVAIDYDAPYEYIWDSSNEPQESTHKIKATARPLHADKTLNYTDTATIILSDNKNNDSSIINASNCSYANVSNTIDNCSNNDVPVDIPGDVNGDKTVNIFDIHIIAADLNRVSGFNSRSDQNNDLIIDLFDMMIVVKNWRMI